MRGVTCESDASSTSNSSISSAAIRDVIDKLQFNQHRGSTKDNYYGIWKNFNEFFIKLDHKPDQWEDRITMYVAYLINENKKSSTVKSYISGIRKRC